MLPNTRWLLPEFAKLDFLFCVVSLFCLRTMPIRYVGRESYFRGKTLFEIASNLRNCGVGRVVARASFVDRYGEDEKSYYHLTKVVPDMTDMRLRKGEAWGVKVFRGENLGERKIEAGMKTDWWLIPKEEEESFCQELAKPRGNIEVPKYAQLPPLLELLMKRDMATRGEDISEPLKLELNIRMGFLNKAVQKEP